MPRAVGRYRQLRCHSCSREWSQVIMSYSDDWPLDRQSRITCTCDTPHVELLPTLRDALYGSTCRAAQRAVVYLMPNGKVHTPFTNAYDDEAAVHCASLGGVRYEFDSVRSMQRFQRDQSAARGFDADDPGAEFVERSRVIDWDQSSIRNHAHDAVHELVDRQRQAVAEIVADGGVASGKGLGYYDRVVERLDSRAIERLREQFNDQFGST